MTTTTTTISPVLSTGCNVNIINTRGETKSLRPAPFVSIAVTPLRNKNAYFGNRYAITLSGTIIAGNTSARFVNPTGPIVGENSPETALRDIIDTQRDLVEFFSIDPLAHAVSVAQLEITPGGNTPAIKFNVRFDSINFEEGPYVATCKYTINLTSEYELIRRNSATPSSGVPVDQPQDLLEDFNETWSFEIDTSYGYGETVSGLPLSARSFIATRTINAVGRNFPTRTLKQSSADARNNIVASGSLDKPAWMQAATFIEDYNLPAGSGELLNGPSGNMSYISSMLSYSRTHLGPFLDGTYVPYNHARTSSIDKSAGSVSVTDTWVLAKSGVKALENYDLSISSSKDNPYISVSIQGSVRGLAPSGFLDSDYAGHTLLNSPFGQARDHYLLITQSGNFGFNSTIYKRANNAVSQRLNAQPLSVAVGYNERAGEITYDLAFDNRPSNYFSGIGTTGSGINVIYENISVSDTYPGDVFAVVPVLGRPTGPILQYTFGRTEYKRDLNIEILLDHTDIGYNTDRASLLLRKPSITEPIRSKLITLINTFSPSQEPGIRKYFLSPPTESWNPKDGRYTLNLGWTYELSE
jgi:hypothetical protein